ncbi:hypothetical protein GCM10010307_11570 [Streptomyces vastus]|uniref:Uncharacterized protein n=1 Tax=Streptomyces vastus TaxID=285451 RepID=A0ABP6CW05_9ACTN
MDRGAVLPGIRHLHFNKFTGNEDLSAVPAFFPGLEPISFLLAQDATKVPEHILAPLPGEHTVRQEHAMEWSGAAQHRPLAQLHLGTLQLPAGNTFASLWPHPAVTMQRDPCTSVVPQLSLSAPTRLRRERNPP